MNIDKNDVWVVIPAYNEEKNICSVIIEVKKYIDNIIVIDDGSRDNTYDAAKKNDEVIVLKHLLNLGKGAAVKTGCDFALKKGAKIIILIDSDGQHDPKEIPNFLQALDGFDIIFGYRQFNKTMPFVFKFGNSFINLATKIIYDISLKDTQSGYRAFTADTYRKIRWKASDYSMESEMIANVGKNHLKYKEIPIKTIYTDKYKGTTIFDGIKIVFNMVLWRFRR